MATALDMYAPYDSGPGADVIESTWRAMARHWRGDGVIRDEGGEFEVYGDSTGMQVKVRTGECWIRGHWGESNTEKTLPIAPADPSLARRDLVVLRNDFLNNRIEVDVLTGTPAASPVYPALAQNTSIWEIQLGRVVVDAGAVTIAANKVQALRTFTDGSCRYGVDAGLQVVANNTFTYVDFDIDSFESSAVTKIGLNKFRLDRPGFWMMTFNLHWASNSTGLREGRIVRAGSTNVIGAHRMMAVSGSTTLLNIVGMDRFTAGEEIQFECRQTSGGNLSITNVEDGTHCTFWWLAP